MIRFSLAIRSVVLLRRIAKALEESNRIQRERMEYEFPPAARRRKTKVAEIFTPSIDQRNELWREENPL